MHRRRSGRAAADDDLISALDNPAVGAVCFPSGQMGLGNTFNGTQNIGCSQSGESTSSGGSGGFTGHEVVTRSVDCPAGQLCGVTVDCPTGKKATGGGVVTSQVNSSIHVVRSGLDPSTADDAFRWEAIVFNGGTSQVAVTAQVICADVDG
ncbi:hypothetical protein [Streptomyces bambusae]|uniref:Uncharacterized protein n=1 Tax=Streptomyces bambusae TaxID=1550616 RepID=A0ABS6ZBK4_9ACTN|nr:hypothetical protein [Streptomyces bambusae]MBW5485134.1 hypothetical protein [Streptomyces bambusae]